MNKFLKVNLIVLLLFSLVIVGGCGTDSMNTDVDKDFSTADQGENTQQENRQDNHDKKELLVYCGAGLRTPMEEIASMFREETGVTIQFSYGGSAQCVGQILLVDKGDLFLPGDVAELKELIERDKIDLQKPVVLHIPVLAVPTGNPAGITGIKDLTKEGVKIALGDPEANPIGKLADKILKDYDLFEKAEPNIIVRAATVNELFAYLALGQAEVAIIWEDNLVGHEKIEMIETAELNDYIKNVPVVTLKCSANPEEAKHFLEYVASEKAIAIWEKYGFKPSGGN